MIPSFEGILSEIGNSKETERLERYRRVCQLLLILCYVLIIGLTYLIVLDSLVFTLWEMFIAVLCAAGLILLCHIRIGKAYSSQCKKHVLPQIVIKIIENVNKDDKASGSYTCTYKLDDHVPLSLIEQIPMFSKLKGKRGKGQYSSRIFTNPSKDRP